MTPDVHTLRSALAVCFSRSSLRRTSLIALAVGCAITLVNQGDVLLSGDAHPWIAAKMALNFVIPFVTSNLGVLAHVRSGSRPAQ